MPASTLKGEARRTAIVTAAADLALDEGLQAVTHRAVASRAGVPLAATTYYFSSRADLLAQGLAAAAEAELARARVAAAREPGGEDPVRVLAELLLDVVVGLDRLSSRTLHGYYARLLEGGRVPEVAAVVRTWQAGLRALLGEFLAAEPGGARIAPRTALALVDGLVVAALGEGEVDREDLVGGLADAVRPMCPGLSRP